MYCMYSIITFIIRNTQNFGRWLRSHHHIRNKNHETCPIRFNGFSKPLCLDAKGGGKNYYISSYSFLLGMLLEELTEHCIWLGNTVAWNSNAQVKSQPTDWQPQQVYCGFPQSLQTNATIAPLIRPQPLPSTFFPVHYSIIKYHSTSHNLSYGQHC